MEHVRNEPKATKSSRGDALVFHTTTDEVRSRRCSRFVTLSLAIQDENGDLVVYLVEFNRKADDEESGENLDQLEKFLSHDYRKLCIRTVELDNSLCFRLVQDVLKRHLLLRRASVLPHFCASFCSCSVWGDLSLLVRHY